MESATHLERERQPIAVHSARLVRYTPFFRAAFQFVKPRDFTRIPIGFGFTEPFGMDSDKLGILFHRIWVEPWPRRSWPHWGRSRRSLRRESPWEIQNLPHST